MKSIFWSSANWISEIKLLVRLGFLWGFSLVCSRQAYGYIHLASVPLYISSSKNTSYIGLSPIQRSCSFIFIFLTEFLWFTVVIGKVTHAHNSSITPITRKVYPPFSPRSPAPLLFNLSLPYQLNCVDQLSHCVLFGTFANLHMQSKCFYHCIIFWALSHSYDMHASSFSGSV